MQPTHGDPSSLALPVQPLPVVRAPDHEMRGYVTRYALDSLGALAVCVAMFDPDPDELDLATRFVQDVMRRRLARSGPVAAETHPLPPGTRTLRLLR